ncbi:uncharacterized protein LOC132698084 [Cylas formicarius]|uniref:uncharacterized protein LOC132698084 n=1 Tax=Cylas formicarius TaxID=197179 RepID=UPI00295888C9|nr:uncharacterized protein LOC132698084 [Cylas formicarius]
MSDCDEFAINVEEIEKDLADIEQKYWPRVNENDLQFGQFREIISILSKEFDSLGLPPLDLSLAMPELFHKVLLSSRALVQMHRIAIALIKDKNIDQKRHNQKNNELYDALDECKRQLDRSRETRDALEKKIVWLTEEMSNMRKRECSHKQELERVKNYHRAKQNEVEHNLRRIVKENDFLKETFGTNISTPSSTNEVALKLLQKHRNREDIYKGTIKKLQETNRDLLDEIFSMKEELVLCDTKK